MENNEGTSKPASKTVFDKLYARIFDNEFQKTVFILVICLLGIIIRVKLFPKISTDVKNFLTPWYDYFKEHGGFKAVGDDIGDYTPMYYYFLAALTYTTLELHVGIKIFSCIFDFIIALYAMKIVALKYPDSNLPYYAFGAVFCLPTVLINSAAWAQCDVIYSAFLIMCLYYIMCGNDRMGMIMFGVSFSFKLQAIFFAPLIGILLMKKKVRFRSLLWVPIVYVISILPATLAGGDFFRLLTVYFRQSGQYPQLTLSFCNIYAIWDGISEDYLGSAATYLAMAIVIMVMYYYISHKKLVITESTVIGLAMISAFLVPFVLPHMHERYWYLSEVMFVIFAFYYKSKIWLILSSQFCSVQILSRFLMGHDSMDMRMLLIIEIVNIVAVYFALRDEINTPTDAAELIMDFEKTDSTDEEENTQPVNAVNTAE